MNFQDIAVRATRSVTGYARQNAPMLLTGAGIAGFVGTAVLVGRASIKAKPVVDDAKANQYTVDHREIGDFYSQRDKAVDTGKIWMETTRDLTKIFAPAIGLGAASIFCIVAAHGISQRRQAAMIAAYTALDSGFRAYRKRVAEELGPDRERQIYHGVKSTRTVETEDGKPCVINEYYDERIADDPRRPSPYARFFDELSPNWRKTPEYNLMFLTAQEQMANDRLKARGILFLNEVYEALGLPWTQGGQVVGWKYDPNDPNKDNYVSFGIHDIFDECNRAFVNGYEHTILLDFNVDGIVQI
jgi:hypothetical protein